MALFSQAAKALEAKLTELLMKDAKWGKLRYTCAATGNFFIGKYGNSQGEFIGLFCDWNHMGAVKSWPITEKPVTIALEMNEYVKAAEYPEITFLTNSCGELTAWQPPQRILDQVPFGDGPGTVYTYLVSIQGQYYILGNQEVPYEADLWTDCAYPPEAVVRASCENALKNIRQMSAPGIIVFPLDFDEMPDRCVISVAIPVRDDARSVNKERLSQAFLVYSDIDKLYDQAVTA